MPKATTTGSGVSAVEFSFYGDDFTGSTDVMEVLEQSGIPTVLFLDPPTRERIAGLPGVRAVGVAGLSRTMGYEQMEWELRPILERVRALGAPVFHYKICSTFDSSPRMGSIGRAAEMVAETFECAVVPIVVGVPQLGRFTAFGTLFATFEGAVYRLDRHPAMSVHPATPMTEADLTRVLAEQTDLPVSVVDSLGLEDSKAVDERLRSAQSHLTILDVADLEQQRRVGRALRTLFSRANSEQPQAVMGSSGVEYALAASDGRELGFAPTGGLDSLVTLVVVGSAAPASRAQRDAALGAGFAGVSADPTRLVGSKNARAELATEAAKYLLRGRHTVVYLDADDRAEVDGVKLGSALAEVTASIVRAASVRRLVVAGGDTSGLVARALGIEALRVARLTVPGSPLCVALSADPSVDGLEVCLKGGAVGPPNLFVQIAEPRSSVG